MKHIILSVGLLAVSSSLFGQVSSPNTKAAPQRTVPPAGMQSPSFRPNPGDELVSVAIKGGDSTGFFQTSAKEEMLPVTVVITNKSTEVVDITHVSTGSTVLMLPLPQAFPIPAGASKSLDLILNSTGASFGGTSLVVVRASRKDMSGVARATVRYGLKDRITMDRPAIAMLGSQGEAQTIRLTSVPAGVKVTGVKAPAGISATIAENAITVTLNEKMEAGSRHEITLITSPEETVPAGPSSDRLIRLLIIPRPDASAKPAGK
jgi:hypothetical protein